MSKGAVNHPEWDRRLGPRLGKHQRTHAESAQVRSVACPNCGAGPTEYCVIGKERRPVYRICYAREYAAAEALEA